METRPQEESANTSLMQFALASFEAHAARHCPKTRPSPQNADIQHRPTQLRREIWNSIARTRSCRRLPELWSKPYVQILVAQIPIKHCIIPLLGALTMAHRNRSPGAVRAVGRRPLKLAEVNLPEAWQLPQRVCERPKL